MDILGGHVLGVATFLNICKGMHDIPDFVGGGGTEDAYVSRKHESTPQPLR